jgi:hypothetical protein
VPFLRFSRDKRGYEHTYLIHAGNRKGAPARILYWYRTPPGVKVGRAAFDDDVRKALEAQYPSIAFDWSKLMDTPPPPPDVEHWRERRRQEKAARQARQATDRVDREDEDEPSDVAEATPEGADAAASDDAGSSGGSPAIDAATAEEPVPASPEAASTGEPGARPRKRRRRGGRRRRKGSQGDTVGDDRGPEAAAGSADIDGEDGTDDVPDADGDATGDPLETESGPGASDSQE